MSLISNLTGGIAQIQQGSDINTLTGININDKTFADILEKQMNAGIEDSSEIMPSLGIPAGFEIQDFFSNGAQNSIVDVARKQAVNIYDKYARSVVTDLGEFVSDSFKLLK